MQNLITNRLGGMEGCICKHGLSLHYIYRGEGAGKVHRAAVYEDIKLNGTGTNYGFSNKRDEIL